MSQEFYCRRLPSLALQFALLFSFGLAQAAVVTLCDSDDQAGSGVNLASALEAGGQISFECGPSATIRITRSHDIKRDTTIDGAGGITLDAEGRKLTMFRIDADSVSLNLANLTVKHAQPPEPRVPDQGAVGLFDIGAFGSVVATSVHDNARVLIDGVSLHENKDPILVYKGSAEKENLLTVRNSEFRNNQGTFITVLGNGGAGDIQASNFIGNELAIFAGGRVLVQGADFYNNTRGAIRVSGSLEVGRSNFAANSSTRGGAILIGGLARKVVLRHTHFENNRASEAGGAIAFEPAHAATVTGVPIPPIPTSVSITYASFSRNQAPRGGAIDANLQDGDQLVLGNGLFDANQATGDGGAIHAKGGAVAIAASIFKNRFFRHFCGLKVRYRAS